MNKIKFIIGMMVGSVFAPTEAPYVTKIVSQNNGQSIVGIGHPENIVKPGDDILQFELSQQNPQGIAYQTGRLPSVTQINGRILKGISDITIAPNNALIVTQVTVDTKAEDLFKSGQYGAQVTISLAPRQTEVAPRPVNTSEKGL